MSKNSAYNVPARILHWLMAVLVLAMVICGVTMVSISSPERHLLVLLHETIGLLILGLGSARLVWRWLGPPAPRSDSEPGVSQRVANATHIAFYGLFFLMPLIGWAMQSAAGYPVVVVGGLHLPSITPVNGAVHAVLRQAHKIGGYGFYGLFLLHLVGALYHTLVLRDGTLRRMLRGRSAPLATNKIGPSAE